jgi:hypothetical protein
MTEAVSEAMKHIDDYVRNGRDSRPLANFLKNRETGLSGSGDWFAHDSLAASK